MEKITTIASYYDSQISFNNRFITNIASKQINTQTHNAIEFIYLKNGNITYTIDEKNYVVENDGLIITLPRKLHKISFNNLDIYERFDIICDEKLIFPEIYEKILKAPDVINCKKLPIFLELFKKFDYYCKHFSGEMLKNLLSHLIDEIAYNVVIATSSLVEMQDYSFDNTFSKIIEFIEINYSKKITLEKICEEMYVSPSYLHYIFRKNLNITPKKYIDLKRLIMAQNYLRTGIIPVKVCEKCGFSDYSVFFRKYKAYFGYSPSEEKNKNVIKDIIY